MLGSFNEKGKLRHENTIIRNDWITECLVFVGLELQQSQRLDVATQIQGCNQMMSSLLQNKLKHYLFERW